jgi:glutamate-1-semialdehyde 2,1-aminomutase
VKRTKKLCAGIGEAAQAAGVPVSQTQVGSMFSTFFTPGPVTDWSSARQSDTARFGHFFQSMLNQGIYLAPSQFEAGFTSSVHSDEVIDATVQAAQEAFRTVA